MGRKYNFDGVVNLSERIIQGLNVEVQRYARNYERSGKLKDKDLLCVSIIDLVTNPVNKYTVVGINDCLYLANRNIKKRPKIKAKDLLERDHLSIFAVKLNAGNYRKEEVENEKTA